MDSPCIDICTMDEASGLCAGCWRSLGEIAAWSRLTPSERHGIMKIITILVFEKIELFFGAQ